MKDLKVGDRVDLTATGGGGFAVVEKIEGKDIHVWRGCPAPRFPGYAGIDRNLGKSVKSQWIVNENQIIEAW